MNIYSETKWRERHEEQFEKGFGIAACCCYVLHEWVSLFQIRRQMETTNVAAESAGSTDESTAASTTISQGASGTDAAATTADTAAAADVTETDAALDTGTADTATDTAADNTDTTAVSPRPPLLMLRQTRRIPFTFCCGYDHPGGIRFCKHGCNCQCTAGGINRF